MDTKEWKNFHPSDTWDWTWTIDPVANRLAAWATWPPKTTMTWIQSSLSHLKETYIHRKRQHCELMLVSAKLRCPPPSLCHKRKVLFEFEKLSHISGWKSMTSALAIGPVRFTTPLPQHLFAIRSVTYGLQAGVSLACRGEDNIPLLQTQWRLVSS